MNDTVKRVIDVIIENRRRFEEFCVSLSDEEQFRPVPDSSWVVKDFAAHLSTLDLTFVRYMDAVARGGRIDMTKDADGNAFDLDAWNDAQVAERRKWPMEKVFDEARANRVALIGQMEPLTEEDISRNMHFSDPKRGAADFPLKAFLVGWAQHDPIHVADMIKALPERGDDLAITAWLANPMVTSYQTSMSTAKA